MIELPDISATIRADMDPLRRAFDSSVAEASAAMAAVSNAMDLSPAVSKAVSRFGNFEQEVRDGMAQTIQQMRAQARQFNVQEEINLRLYGPKAMEADLTQAQMFEQRVQQEMTRAVESMALQAEEFNVQQEAKLRLYGPQQAAADIAQATEAVEVIEEEVAEAAGVMESLKGQFGRGSALFEMGHLLEGAGPILGISLVTRVLGEATEKATEFVDEFRAGTIAADELPGKLAASLPILGDIFKIEENIRDAITGEGEAIKEVTDDAKRMSEAVDQVRHAMEFATGAVETCDKQFEQIADRVNQLLHPVNAFAQALKGEVAQAATDAANSVQKANEDIAKTFGKQGIANLDQMKARIDQLQADANRSLPELTTKYYYDESGGGTETNQAEIDEAKKAREDARGQLGTLKSAYDEYQKSIVNAWQSEAKVANEAIVATGVNWLNGVAGKIHQMRDEVDKHTTEARKQIDAMQKQVDQFGMSDAQKKASDFAHQAGATPAMLAQYKQLADQLDQLNDKKKVGDKIGEYFDSIKSPIEKATDHVKELLKWVDEGRITMKQAHEGVVSELAKARGHEADNKKTPEHFADLIDPTKGGGAALKLQFQAMRENDDKDPTQDKQLAAQEKMVDFLDRIQQQTDFTVIGPNDL